jgi:hypothetical protein
VDCGLSRDLGFLEDGAEVGRSRREGVCVPGEGVTLPVPKYCNGMALGSLDILLRSLACFPCAWDGLDEF